MAPARRIAGSGGELWLVRPLLSVPRADVEAHLVARGLDAVADPTNDDRAYRRSRLRHEVLPLLRRERPDLDGALAETCARLRADADALDGLAADAARRLADADGTIDAVALAALPDALFARVVAAGAGVVLGAVHVAALRRLRDVERHAIARSSRRPRRRAPLRPAGIRRAPRNARLPSQ